MRKWWHAWLGFMFNSSVSLVGSSTSSHPAAMLQKIKRAKYPKVTEQEEIISIPLQTLCQAIFDAVLVHIVNSVSPDASWQPLRTQMCNALNKGKVRARPRGTHTPSTWHSYPVHVAGRAHALYPRLVLLREFRRGLPAGGRRRHAGKGACCGCGCCCCCCCCCCDAASPIPPHLWARARESLAARLLLW